MTTLTLAFRNVLNHRYRNLITLIAMTFACAMMIVFSALMAGFTSGVERNVVAMNTGDIQIHQPSYRFDPSIYKLIPEPKEIAAELRKQSFFAAIRLFAYGLMVSENGSSAVQLRGINLSAERTVTELDKHILVGAWLRDEQPHNVVIGKKLARLLNVSLGDELTFIGQTTEGYTANDLFKVVGILKSVSTVVDNSAVFMVEPMLRELMTIPTGAHQIVLMRKDRNSAITGVTQQLEANLGDHLEVKNWKQLMPVIHRFLQTADIQVFIMMIFTYIAVGSVVLNAVLMNVFERTREFGIFKALGVRPGQLIQMIYIEMMILTTAAIGLAVLVGTIIAHYIELNGIDMSHLASEISFSGLAFDPIWYAKINPETIWVPVLFLYLISAIAALFPAVKVAKLDPVKAIYHS